MLFHLLLFLPLVFGATTSAEPEKVPLQLRAEAAMKGFDQLQTEGQKRERQQLLLALADSLEAGGFDVHASHCLERSGIFSYQFAEYDRAQVIWERGLEVARRSGDDRRIAALLNANAIGVSVTGDDERAVVLQQELILKRREIDDPRGEGVSWYNLAYSYEALYRMPEAIEAFRCALRLHLQTGNDYGAALTRSALANELFTIGQIQEAMALADSAVVDARRQGAPLLVGTALASRAGKLYLLGRHEAALDDFEASREILVTTGASRVAAANAIGEARVRTALGQCDDSLSLLDEVWSELDRDEARAERIAWRAARGRALAACERPDEARPVLREALADLSGFRAGLETELGRAESFRLAGAAYADLAAIETAEEAWRLTEESSGALLRAEMESGIVGLEEFQESLGRVGATALQFGAATPEHVVACVVNADTVRTQVLRIPRDFALQLATAMQLLASGADNELCEPVLTRIAAVLLDPLVLDADRLIVVPGAFAGLPFEALPYAGAELGRAVPTSYAPSATAFVRLQQRSAATGRMVVFADPALPPADGPDLFADLRQLRSPLAPLPQAREEARGVATATARVYERDQATRERFAAACTGPGVIHLATHAIVDASHPAHSALVLAGGDPLDAQTIGGLELGADLVSLSGCSTAAGYLVAGEGTFGLTRAFLVAGARSVVASWWDVEDAAARHFMELFYARLASGEDRDRALQSARGTMAEEGYPPRDRLAFALVGATGEPVPALEAAFPRPWLWPGTALLGLLLLGIWFAWVRQN